MSFCISGVMATTTGMEHALHRSFGWRSVFYKASYFDFRVLLSSYTIHEALSNSERGYLEFKTQDNEDASVHSDPILHDRICAIIGTGLKQLLIQVPRINET